MPRPDTAKLPDGTDVKILQVGTGEFYYKSSPKIYTTPFNKENVLAAIEKYQPSENIQPMNTTYPTPQPFPPPTPGLKAPQTSIDISPDLAPEDDQDETDDGRNDIIPDTGITEQPETQQPEDSSEGAETAGPLT